MELRTIKERLTIKEVLAYYGLQPDKHDRFCCPFHPDKTPSLQIYPATNTFCCFSSNCSAGTGDVIQFIQLKENCTKHEALVKATELVHGTTATTLQPSSKARLTIDTDLLTREVILTKVFSYYQRGLRSAKNALAYLQGRGLDHTKLSVAYNSGGLHTESKNHHLVTSMVQMGLLKSRSAGGYTVWAKDCVLFPLKNTDNKIVSLYGRSITNNSDSRHFYLSNRMGLYPGYPSPTTTKLILTESIIDAASLLQQAAIAEQYSILALFGTNGLTDEHTKAISNLPHLSEIILILNADEAATERHYHTLQQLLPDGEDVNSVLQTHDDPKLLSDLIEQRTDFSFQLKEKNPEPAITLPTETRSLPLLPSANKLNTIHPELLIYTDKGLRIEVLGGIKITGLDRLRVNGKVAQASDVSPLQNAVKGVVENTSSSGIPNPKPEGAAIINELIASDKVVTIEASGNGNKITTLSTTDQSNGEGTGSTISYNPDNKGAYIVNSDFSKGRPSHIGLSHELKHAQVMARGSRNTDPVNNVKDPDTKITGVLNVDEIDTRRAENAIRREQGVVDRMIPTPSVMKL